MVKKLLLNRLVLGVFIMSIASSCHSMTKLGGQTIHESFSEQKVVSLVKAAVAGDVGQVAMLATRGANVNAIGSNGATPLFWALNARSHNGVEALLHAGADPNLLTTKIGYSPMYFVAMGDDSELLRLLLRFGGNPNHPGQGAIEDRPLTQAAAKGRIENLRLLLAAGADVNAHDSYDETAVTNAIGLAKFEAVAFMLEHGYDYKLESLARRVKIRRVRPESDAQFWKEKVLVMLKDRGVSISSQ
ncbi:MAG: hypothetical protein C0508_22505 [Cyanobacteria bacterium PR.023]|nr:hypothetical protein [Cyanobacteria bacterium PR.023]MDO9621658.1 ankyrin repeat domain-containing protein [Moraxellaceae bacterium]MDZ4297134.1 ankyrin repeat domain-containing protein [Moraxellaceae bacterium]MDZ4387532.1 ankyrin repeat domain-containing protein [Moraxellaceae bacterium]